MSEISNNLFDDDEGDESSTDSGATGAESGEAKDPKSESKRISDLQSAKDKETARANKLQKQLDAIAAATKDNGVEDIQPSAQAGFTGDSAIIDMARMFAFQQNPKLATYGLTMDDLNGANPSEIARSATELVARFEKIETQVRNKVLAENGMAPEIDAGSPPAPARDFTKMSKEDFDKVVAGALGKR